MTVLLLVAAAAFVAASPAAAPPGRYAGTTSQKQPIHLRVAVARGRETVAVTSVGYRFRCSDGSTFSRSSRFGRAATVSPSRRFTIVDRETGNRLTGTLGARRAVVSGSFTWRIASTTGVFLVRCTTGRVTFVASLVPAR